TLSEADLARDDLRNPPADAAASAVAAIPGVRTALLGFQRRFAAARGAVLDGRDIGTVIFPDATVKFFVTASLEARARRRALELAGRGIAADPATVERDIRARDERDAARAQAPLTAAADAITLDTTDHDSEAVFGAACRIVTARLEARGVAVRHTGM
ncbi:MAG: (d)CMP kinase, partial [Acetobacteraceae bacterium]|nr:(d)CMP kinase [Acetobacteraceae bacterium]